MKSKVRKVQVHISADEINRIRTIEEQFSGINVEIIVTHSNIKIQAKTNENQNVELCRIS